MQQCISRKLKTTILQPLAGKVSFSYSWSLSFSLLMPIFRVLSSFCLSLSLSLSISLSSVLSQSTRDSKPNIFSRNKFIYACNWNNPYWSLNLPKSGCSDWENDCYTSAKVKQLISFGCRTELECWIHSNPKVENSFPIEYWASFGFLHHLHILTLRLKFVTLCFQRFVFLIIFSLWGVGCPHWAINGIQTHIPKNK